MKLSKETKRKILGAKFVLTIIMTISFIIMDLKHTHKSPFLLMFGFCLVSLAIYTFCSFVGHFDADDDDVDHCYYDSYKYLLSPKYTGRPK